jgi:4-hydroxybenzoate polyprenyltransferase
MMSYLKLFRWPNLLVVAITQYLFRYAILEPLLGQAGYELSLSHFEFFLLVVATILISAAGYAINDYFDLRTDRINKPQKIILGKSLSRRSAIFYHSLFNLIALIIGIYLSLRVGQWQLIFLFWSFLPCYGYTPSGIKENSWLVTSLLVFCQHLSLQWYGYLIIMLWRSWWNPDPELLVSANRFVRTYGLFAFITTLMREIIKDIEDIKGDAKIGCRTIPIISGIRATKKIIILILVSIIGLVAYFQIYLSRFDFDLLFAYIIVAIQIPLVLLIQKTISAKEKSDYHNLSRFAKVIMLSGVFTMFLFYFYFQQGILPE